MGHYDSLYEEDDRQLAKEQREREKKLQLAIQKDIDKRGVAAVLADICTDLTGYKIRNS